MAPILMQRRRYFFFDTETYPIRGGLLAPKLVCLQWAYDDDAPTITLARDAAAVFRAALASGAILVAHNGAFDYAVMAAHDESLVQPIFRALAEYRCHDTQLLETLVAIRRGELDFRRKRKGEFTLATIAFRYCGIALDKGEESWRLRYALLDGIDPKDWPEAARKYAEEDVTSLRAVYYALIATGEFPDAAFQSAVAFALHLCACWGTRTDGDALQWVEVALLTKQEAAREALIEAKLFRQEDLSVDRKAVQASVEAACIRLGRAVPKTNPTALQMEKFAKGLIPEPKGSTKTDGETIEDLGAELKLRYPDEKPLPLLHLVDHGAATKILSTYVEPLKPGILRAINSRPNALVASGRTSWGGSKLKEYSPWWPEGCVSVESKESTNLQNFPQEEGVRDLIIPRKGHWFSSTDYSALELRTLAQCVLWMVGYSTLANGFKKDPDWDPHSYFAGHLTNRSYEEALSLHKKGDKEFKYLRKIAKNLNFALPGGVGAKKFQWMAKQAGIILTIEQCYYYKNEWLQAFPEMKDFFDVISGMVNAGIPFRQFVSSRVRGQIGFCDGCNTGFQGLGGDISKYALFLVSMACYAEPQSVLYRSRPIALVHDEILAESPIDIAPEATMEIMRLMNVSFSAFCPDIPARAEPTLMTRWIKAAAPRYDASGRLTAWDL